MKVNREKFRVLEITMRSGKKYYRPQKKVLWWWRNFYNPCYNYYKIEEYNTLERAWRYINERFVKSTNLIYRDNE